MVSNEVHILHPHSPFPSLGEGELKKGERECAPVSWKHSILLKKKKIGCVLKGKAGEKGTAKPEANRRQGHDFSADVLFSLLRRFLELLSWILGFVSFLASSVLLFLFFPNECYKNCSAPARAMSSRRAARLQGGGALTKRGAKRPSLPPFQDPFLLHQRLLNRNLVLNSPNRLLRKLTRPIAHDRLCQRVEGPKML